MQDFFHYLILFFSFAHLTDESNFFQPRVKETTDSYEIYQMYF